MNKDFSKTFCILMRIFAIIALLMLLVINAFKFNSLTKINSKDFYIEIGAIIINYIVCIICVLLIKFPTRLSLVSYACLLYTIVISTLEPESYMNIFMFFLAINCFLVSGFYDKNKQFKIFFTIAAGFLILIISLILNDYYRSIKNFLKTSGYIFVYALNTFLIRFYYSRTYLKTNILDCSKYINLTKRDSEWLNAIVKREKYETIARKYDMSEGYVRNRILYIYKELGIKDKTEFLNKYDHYHFVFNEK